MPRKKKVVRFVAIHPGEFLREDFLKPLSLSVNALAIALQSLEIGPGKRVAFGPVLRDHA